MKKYDLYLFDFDGTLFDTMPALNNVFIKSYAAVGIHVEVSECLQFSREPLPYSFKRKGGKDEEFAYFYQQIEKYLNCEQCVKDSCLYPESRAFFEYVNGHHINAGVVTSNNTQHVQDVLTYFKLPIKSFIVYVGNHECQTPKPSPLPIETALKMLDKKFSLDKVVYVGDALNDMLAAKNAGIDGILIDRENVFPESKDYIKISSLLDLFNQLNT